MNSINTNTNIILPLEVRLHILLFTGNNFKLVLKSILGGNDILHNYKKLLNCISREQITVYDKLEVTCKSVTMQLPDSTLHHTNKPSYLFYRNDILTKERWNILDKHHRHRESILPTVTAYYDNGSIEYNAWFRNDEPHRIKLPAVIEYYEDGNIRRECYYAFGISDRMDHGDDDKTLYHTGLPTILTYNTNGSIIKEEYHLNGLLHRENDLPAKKCIDPDKHLDVTFTWYTNGICCRDNDMPADIRQTKEGITKHSWYENGNKHRKTLLVKGKNDNDGLIRFNPTNYFRRMKTLPSEIIYDEYNYVIKETWYEHGVEKHVINYNNDGVV